MTRAQQQVLDAGMMLCLLPATSVAASGGRPEHAGGCCWPTDIPHMGNSIWPWLAKSMPRPEQCCPQCLTREGPHRTTRHPHQGSAPSCAQACRQRSAGRTRSEQDLVGVDGGDGAHSLADDGVPDGVAGGGPPQRVSHDLEHVLAGSLVTLPQKGQQVQQLQLHAVPGSPSAARAPRCGVLCLSHGMWCALGAACLMQGRRREGWWQVLQSGSTGSCTCASWSSPQCSSDLADLKAHAAKAHGCCEQHSVRSTGIASISKPVCCRPG